ncbi:MAG: DDE-type integrase/transposase/recombinase [Ruminococcus sp.]|nr:DDE-type integrase/transposase/recombinase [Ruminococcus sp.]
MLKLNFTADEPNKKCVTDITEMKASNGKPYLSAIFDCFDLLACGHAMDTNIKASLRTETVDNALKLHPELTGAIIHSYRESQYTSDEYRRKIAAYNLKQSRRKMS